jgi:uridine kinase
LPAVLPAPAADKKIVPGSSNELAIELLVDHIKRQLDSRSLRFRNMLARLADEVAKKPLSSDYTEEGVILLEQTPQLKVNCRMWTSGSS